MIDLEQESIMKNWDISYKTPLVSIKCMAYNHEKYISDAMDGFLMQKTNFPFEIIVHDDASTDKTSDIIREYENKYPDIVKPIYETENQYSKPGVSVSAIMYPYLTGKYIAFCEGDDYWIDENKLQVQVDFLESHPDYSMCFHNAKVLDELGNHNNFSYNVKNKDYTPTELFKNWCVPTASILCKKDLFSVVLKNETDFIYGDIKIIEICAHNGKVHGFDSFMSVYRIQQNGITWKESFNAKRFALLPKHYKAIKTNFPKIEKKIINNKIVESYLLCVLKIGNPLQKILWLFAAFFTSPISVFKQFVIYMRKKNEL